MSRDFATPVPYIDHEGDFSREPDGQGGHMLVDLPGFLEIGFIVNGVKIPLKRLKAGDLLPLLDAAKEADDEAAALPSAAADPPAQ
jgi:hypothetical protein